MSLTEKVHALLTPTQEQLLASYEDFSLEYWDGGNADDTFELGVSVGHALAIRKVLQLLNENGASN